MRASVPLDNTNLTVLLNLFLSFFCFYLLSVCTLAANGLGLYEEAELEAQMFSLAQMFIRMPNVQFSTEPAFLQNPCWWQYFIRVSFLRLGLQTLH
jgi:hypothetical protein